MINCTHTITTRKLVYDDWLDDSVLQEVTEYTTESVDAFHYRCTQCGEIISYPKKSK